MSILISTPCYGGVCTTAYMISCMRLQEELIKAGVEHDFNIGRNESLVTRARNEMASWFMKTEFQAHLWIDADIEFDVEDVGKLWHLLQGGADIAVAAYSMKLPDKPLSAWKDGKLVKIEECPSEPFPVDYAGTGFMMIGRKVYEKLAKTTETYEGPDGRVNAFFMTPVHNDGFESEDYHFCRKAREAGFEITMDPSIRLGHIGQFRYGN
jgi:hypothetical protein